jgi:hypothetical protein
MLDIRDAAYDLPLNLERMERWPGPDEPEGNPLDQLREGRPADFVFGETLIPLQTRQKEGWTAVGISIWDDKDGWPIDGLTIPVCVASSDSRSLEVCPARTRQTDKSGGPDFARLLRDHGPDAAIHVVGLGSAGVGGFFRRNDIPNAPFYAWRLHGREDEFIRNLRARVAEFGAQAEDAEEVANLGEQLYGYLFAADDPANRAAHAARVAFEEFARPYLTKSPASHAAPPTLYVRFLRDRLRPDDERNATLLPFALAKVGTEPDAFLGFHFKIEIPLPTQIPEEGSPCISRWKLFLPVEDPDFRFVLRRIAGAVSQWSAASRVSRMRELKDWLATERDDPNATALVVLSHAGERAGDVRLVVGRGYVASEQIRRTFNRPSVAILNGCSVAAPGSERFVKVLNEHGVDAVIAARHEVGKEMAADFFDCLARALPAPDADRGSALGDLYFQTIQCLRQRSSYPDTPAYGAAALAYGLFGNSELLLCGPHVQEGQ